MKSNDRKSKIILIIGNILLILVTIIGAATYSRHIYEAQENGKKTDFIRTIESMKQVSQNYLDSEKGYVQNWAHYVSENNMTLEEALDFVRRINTNKDCFAHIVDMDTYYAYSSYYPKGKEEIYTYVQYKKGGAQGDLPFSDIMQNMFKGTEGEFDVLGKYRLDETQATGVAVGTRVTLKTDEGSKDYLMLRIIPTEILKKSWVFPTEYSSAEVGIITNSGDYVIQSPSMKSQNFLEYICTYNFEDNYNERDDLKEQLKTSECGTLQYKNFRGKDCIWYYSSFGSDSSLDIIGALGIDELKASVDVLYIIFSVFGILIVLVVIDGIYLVGMNHRLREAARLSEQASRAKTQFLSAMSHDIRTPLNAVLGMMEIAQKRAADPEYVKECMDKGMHSGRQLMTLINDVLDISKIESGKVTLNPEKVNLTGLMGDLEDMLSQDIVYKKITLDCDYDEIPNKYIYADRMRLNQIYVNLLSNAVKYTENGGKIILRLYEEAADDDTFTKLVFYVKDNGIGMTEEFQKHMYSTFEREIKTQVNRTQGTGLGLAIVKQMVDLMGGTIECESSPGEGTAFKVSIKFKIADGYEDGDTGIERADDICDMKLLIAEDNDLNWEIVNELLSEKGIKSERAKNGKECVDMLCSAQAGTYSAVFMDVHMPVMDGYEATGIIRGMEDDNINKIPIIAMTADAFAEDVQECLDCGMNGHVAKPVNIDKIIGYLVKIKNNRL